MKDRLPAKRVESQGGGHVFCNGNRRHRHDGLRFVAAVDVDGKPQAAYRLDGGQGRPFPIREQVECLLIVQDPELAGVLGGRLGPRRRSGARPRWRCAPRDRRRGPGARHGAAFDPNSSAPM
jgi:hypothetical protein